MYNTNKMTFVNSNTSLVHTRNRYKWLFLLGMVFCFGMANAQVKYYLTSAGASDADDVGSWNTNANGSGTALSSWTTGSTNDTFVVPVGIVGEWNTSRNIGASNANAQSFTFEINGSLTITDNSVITFDGSANVVTWTTNGTLTINEEGGDETFKSANIDYAYFKFSSGSTSIINNQNGISAADNSIFGTDLDFIFLHNPGANYRFVNTANNTTTNGLNDTLNQLTI
jgi:hypothetical protein